MAGGKGNGRNGRGQRGGGGARWVREVFLQAGDDPAGPLAQEALFLLSIGRSDLVKKLLQPLEERAGQRALLGRAFPLRTGLPTSGILLGTATDEDRDGEEVRIPALDRPVLVCGLTGTGKSTLVCFIAKQLLESSYVVQLVDPENEFGPLLSMFPPEVLSRFLVSDLKINPFQVPAGVAPETWISRICDLLTVYYAHEGLNLIERALRELYTERGVVRGSRRWPTPRDVLRRLRSYRFEKSSPDARYHGTALKVLRFLTGRMGGTFDVRESMPMDRLAVRSCILGVHEVRNLDLEFFLSLFLELTAGTHKQPRVLIFDEAHILLSRYRANRTGLKEPPLEEAVRRLRKRLTSLIVVDQAPALLPPAVQSNFATIVSLRMPNYQDRVFVGSATGLPREETDGLATLGSRLGVVSNPAYPGPALFRVPELAFPEAPDPAVVREQAEAVLRAELPFVPASPIEERVEVAPRQRPGGTTEKARSEGPLFSQTRGVKGPALNYLADLARDPLLSVTSFDRKHGFSAGKGNALRRELMVAGLIEVLKFTTGGRGSRVHVPWITEAGYAVLREMELPDKKPAGRGSEEAKYWAHRIARDLRRVRPEARVAIEMARDGKAFDVGSEEGGELVAYEIQLSSPRAHATENLVRDTQAGGRVVFCAKSQEDLEAIKRKVEHDLAGDERWRSALERAEYRLLRSFEEQ